MNENKTDPPRRKSGFGAFFTGAFPPPPPSKSTSDDTFSKVDPKLSIVPEHNSHPHYPQPPFSPVPPPTPASNFTKNPWSETVEHCDGSKMLQLIVEEANKYQYRRKSLEQDYEIVKNMVTTMHSILSHEFLKVNFSSKPRDIKKDDWSLLDACYKSENGTKGVYFLQCKLQSFSNPRNSLSGNPLSPSNSATTPIGQRQQQLGMKELIVAKAFTKSEFKKTEFITELANCYFGIKSPKVRYLDRYGNDEKSNAIFLLKSSYDSDNDEDREGGEGGGERSGGGRTEKDGTARSEPPSSASSLLNEFITLEESVKKLFQPLYQYLYEIGGSSSPKDLFSSKGIMLMEFISGKTLSHRSNGQRSLGYADYKEIGKIFLFDLLIRNIDRFPCSKAFPRTGSTSLLDNGNPGNIMFGIDTGTVWSIDPDIQIPNNESLQKVYRISLQSVVKEILFRYDLDRRYKSIETLFFSTIPGLEDILPLPLADIRQWDRCNETERTAISYVLGLIRLKVIRDPSIVEETRGNDDDENEDDWEETGKDTAAIERLQVPMDNNEMSWREWIRQITPRIFSDLFQFIEIHTGFTASQIPYNAIEAFYTGFVESLDAAIRFKSETDYHDHILSSSENSGEIKASLLFVLDMITAIEPYWHEMNGGSSGTVNHPPVPHHHSTSPSSSSIPVLKRAESKFFLQSKRF
jgi:hypothetical protein